MTSVNPGPASSTSSNAITVAYNPSAGLSAGSTVLGPYVTQSVATLTAANSPFGAGARAAPFTVAPTPTITTNSTPMASAQLIQALPNFQAPINPAFFIAAPPSAVIPLGGSGSPEYTVLVGDCPANSLTPFAVSFYHSGSQLDIIKFQSGQGFSLWVDDVYVGYFNPPLVSGTATAGGAGTITLAAGSSSTTGFYNGYTVVQGSQIGKITAYNGGTLVATVSGGTFSAAAYTLTEDSHGYQLLAGVRSYVNLNWGNTATRKITLWQIDFQGINIGPNDSLWAAPPEGPTRFIVIGDSQFTVTNGPFCTTPPQFHSFGRFGGFQMHCDGEAGTGFVYNSGAGRLNYQDRIAPPNESWWLNLVQPSSGTFTLSVTYAGTTQTSAPIAWNAAYTTVQSAVQALTNLPPNSVAVAGANSIAGFGYIILLRGVTGAVLTVNTSALVGSFPPGLPSLTRWAGVVANRVPLDGAGNALPFVLFVQGSSNDVAGNGVTTAQIQAAAQYIAQQVTARFPTAICIFSGVMWITTQAGTGVIAAADLAVNAAIKAGAALLNPVGNNIPFIDTMAAGLGGNSWIFGSGTIANPTINKNDILISVTTAGHPSGDGQAFLGTRMMQYLKALLGAV